MFDKHIISIDFQTFFVSFIILGVSLFRLIPQMNNFSPILALAIFGALNFRNKELLYFILIISLWLSDLIINNYIYNFSGNIIWFYEGFYWQYISYLIIISMCANFNGVKNKFFKVLFLILSSSMLFFILSNFGYWLTSGLYEHTIQGFSNCYVAAIPFYKGTLYGTLFYTPILFILYFVLQKKFLILKPNNLVLK